MQNFISLEASIASNAVAESINTDVSHMEVAGGIGKHR
jgi:hypothetical protein